MEPPRWNIITPSQYEWERRGLDFIRAGLPNHDPYRAWANFEFQAPNGAIYEVDLLVQTKQGFWLVEIKSWPGHVRGDAGTWTRTHNGKTISEDNPVMLANRKAKTLVSLLKSQQAARNIRVPWMEAVVFLSADDLQCDLTGPALNRVLVKDRLAKHVQLPNDLRRVRMYSVAQADSEEDRQNRKRAAIREYENRGNFGDQPKRSVAISV